MILAGLDELARRYGVDPYDKQRAETSGSISKILAALGVDASSQEAIAASLSRSQDREPPVLRPADDAECYLPSWLEQGRAWGISVQLYELRSRRNWGMGDFADLALMCQIAAAAGADFVGTNPLHALFVSDPARCSPFSPSNRLFLNPLYIAVDQVPGYAPQDKDEAATASLRELPEVDYVGVAELKIRVLRDLWRRWKATQPGLPPFSQQDFVEFRDRHGASLQCHAVFEALSLSMVAANRGSGWTGWPREFHRPDSASVRRFARENRDEVSFHTWLQWIADAQLAQCASIARQAGMRIGIYLDFAVGEVGDGSGNWTDRELSVAGMSIGAPPDMFSATGQDWGLAPVSPITMERSACDAFRRTNQALMRNAGALRIDHAMSLWQLFFVPEGSPTAEGAYVRYPLEQLLAILAEQSLLFRTIVIGEDLGIVPPGFREVMRTARILSYRILYFEKAGSSFIDPGDYPRLALACVSTHDMPTLGGWWRGDDIELRLKHELIGQQAAVAQREERARERRELITTFQENGLLRQRDLSPTQCGSSEPSAFPPIFAVAAHRFIAGTPSVLASARLSDLTGESRQTNLPGTVDSYPNWRIKSSVSLEDLASTELFRSITDAMAAERPRPA